MYELIKEKIARQEVYTIKCLKGDSYFSVIASMGASLHALVLNGRKVIKSWNDGETLMAAQTEKYAGTQLFPFPNRLHKGQYEVNGETYHFPHNDFGKPNALHGHIGDKRFNMSSFDSKNGSFSFSYNYQGNDVAYPFPYSITNQFTLSKDRLTIKSTIKNLSELSIPMAHGWHPYFITDFSVDRITIPSEYTFTLDEDLIPTGHKKPYPSANKPDSMALLHLNACFPIIKASPTDPSPVLMLHFINGQTLEIHTKDYGFLQIYTPPDRKSIAIEPQTAAPDAFRNEIGLRHLAPGDTWDLEWAIGLSKG